LLLCISIDFLKSRLFIFISLILCILYIVCIALIWSFWCLGRGINNGKPSVVVLSTCFGWVVEGFGGC
jgi:hypothetical protein